jgi:hypothetical protein
METPSDFVIPTEIDLTFTDLESKLMALLGSNSSSKIGEIRYTDGSIYKGGIENGTIRQGFGSLITP